MTGKCVQDFNAFTLEPFGPEELLIRLVQVGDILANLESPDVKGECTDLTGLLTMLVDEENNRCIWVPEPGMDMDPQGYGGTVSRQMPQLTYVRLINPYLFSTGAVHSILEHGMASISYNVRMTSMYVSTVFKGLRVGNCEGLFTVSGQHGSLPGEDLLFAGWMPPVVPLDIPYSLAAMKDTLDVPTTVVDELDLAFLVHLIVTKGSQRALDVLLAHLQFRPPQSPNEAQLSMWGVAAGFYTPSLAMMQSPEIISAIVPVIQDIFNWVYLKTLSSPRPLVLQIYTKWMRWCLVAMMLPGINDVDRDMLHVTCLVALLYSFLLPGGCTAETRSLEQDILDLGAQTMASKTSISIDPGLLDQVRENVYVKVTMASIPVYKSLVVLTVWLYLIQSPDDIHIATLEDMARGIVEQSGVSPERTYAEFILSSVQQRQVPFRPNLDLIRRIFGTIMAKCAYGGI